jgi:citrate synthase
VVRWPSGYDKATPSGIPASSVRGVVLIARTAGLVAHLAEEARHPIGRSLWLETEARAQPLEDD